MRRSAELRLAALLCAGLLAGCKGASYWQDRVQSDPLYRRAAQVRVSASCGKLVPMAYGQTVPVPVKGGRFKVLFYPLTVSPGKSEALAPAFEGVFSAGGADADACAALPKAATSSRGPAVPPGTSQAAYYRAEAALYASLVEAGRLYDAGASPSEADKRALTDFLDAFEAVAEPGLLPDYYRAEPGFWEWLRAGTGRSIPKPAA